MPSLPFSFDSKVVKACNGDLYVNFAYDAEYYFIRNEYKINFLKDGKLIGQARFNLSQ